MAWEFHVDVDCPHCGEAQHCCAEFDPDSFGDHGGPSFLAAVDHCVNFECDKPFWFRAYLRFDLDVEDVFKKDPAKPRKKRSVAREATGRGDG